MLKDSADLRQQVQVATALAGRIEESAEATIKSLDAFRSWCEKMTGELNENHEATVARLKDENEAVQAGLSEMSTRLSDIIAGLRSEKTEAAP